MRRTDGCLVYLLVVGCSGSSSPAELQRPPPAPAAQESTPEKDPPPSSAPPDPPDFTRFVIESRPEACHPSGDGDCESRVEVTASGEMTLDPWGEPQADLLRTSVDAASVRALAEVLLGDAVAPYFSGEAACDGTHPSEVMTLERGGKAARIVTGHCNDAAIQAARGAVFDLAREAFPGHHVMDPPI